MTDPQVHALLDVLHEKKTLPAESTASPLERSFKKTAFFLCVLSAGWFLLICLLAAGVALFQLSSPYWLDVANVLLAGSLISTLSWMFADTLPTLVTILLFDAYAHRKRQLEISHDFQNAVELGSFDISTIKTTDKWLSLLIERMRLRLGVFLGGSDKVAAIALMVGAWGIWTNFPSKSTSWEQYAYAGFSALVGGLAIGGVLMNSQIKKLAYQRDLLALALHMRQDR